MGKYEIGETKKSKDIGYKGTAWYAWLPCMVCRKERWVMLEKGKPASIRCHECACPRRQRNENQILNEYRYVYLPKASPYYTMANKRGRVREHRLIIAQFLQRCLLPWEVVHHKNGLKGDNRIENLELLPHNRWHLVDMKTRGYIKSLENKIRVLQRVA